MRLTLIFVLMLASRPDIGKFFSEFSSGPTSVSNELPDSARDNTDSDEVSEIEVQITLILNEDKIRDYFASSTTQLPRGILHSFLDTYLPRFHIPPSFT